VLEEAYSYDTHKDRGLTRNYLMCTVVDVQSWNALKCVHHTTGSIITFVTEYRSQTTVCLCTSNSQFNETYYTRTNVLR
jgi:hypothetical protein